MLVSLTFILGDMAVILRLVYGRFIEVWRQKGQAARKNKMTQILLRNASHEG